MACETVSRLATWLSSSRWPEVERLPDRLSPAAGPRLLAGSPLTGEQRHAPG